MINRAGSGRCICGHSIEDHFPCGLDYGGHVCLGGQGLCDCDEYEEAPVIMDENPVDESDSS